MDAELRAALDAIDPATLSYDEWLNVMGALKDAGADYDEADEWNRRDAARYDEQANRKHWDSLHDPASPDVARKTIFKLANGTGWRWHGQSTATPPTTRKQAPQKPTYPLLDLTKDVALPEPPDLTPAEQLRTQLAAMFYKGEHVNTFTRGARWNEQRQKWEPVGWGTLTDVMGFWDEGYTEQLLDSVNPPAAGAWLRINPVCDAETLERMQREREAAGKERRKSYCDEHVTAYRYALVEFDNMPVDEQLRTYARLRLPCAAIVESAGKSAHAFVRVDANTRNQYAERVGWLYGFFEANGLHLDKANKNPSRWARLAGAERNGKVQRLVAVNKGFESWDEWREWVDQNAIAPEADEAEDEDTDEQDERRVTFEDVSEFLGEPLEQVPVLIDGLLHRGHVMGIIGSAGIGKSWMLIELAVSIATGGWWMGYKCERGKVLFVNPEIDGPNLRNRIRAVCQLMGVSGEDLGHRLQVLNLRGQAIAVDGVRAALAGMGEFSAILLDSIYMLSDADENAASEVKGLFADLMGLANDHNASVIFSHHTGKGVSGARSAKDRARGSSVFVGAPDTMLTLDPLDVDPDSAAWQLLRTYDRDVGARRMWATAWRLTAAKVRAWPTPSPVNLVYTWPTHQRDDTGELEDCPIVGTPKSHGKKGGEKNAARAKDLAERQAAALDAIIEQAACDGNVPTRAYCLPMFNDAREDMGLEAIGKATFATYTRKGGLLPHRVDAATNALYRPPTAEDE